MIIDVNKNVEKFVFNIEKNILSFSLNKCVADIYTLFNYLEKTKTYLHNSDLSKKILTCIFPILPKLALSINKNLFDSNEFKYWPNVNKNLLLEDKITLPIQIQGKLITTIDTKKGYSQEEIMESICKLDRVKNKIIDKKIIKVINVQDKIINIITN